MKTINPKDLATAELHALLQGAVTPRPIAFVSSINEAGEVNLSPFSFFNLFSANPPILVFSPSRRVRDNTTKHTLDNVLEVPEVVIHVVGHDLVEQMSLASTEYAKGVNEFPSVSIKAQLPLIWAAHRFLTHSLAGDSVGSFSQVSKPIASYLGGVISFPDSLKSAHFLFVFSAPRCAAVSYRRFSNLQGNSSLPR